MTRGVLMTSPQAGKAKVGRVTTDRARLLTPALTIMCALVLVLILSDARQARAAKKDGLPEGVITEVKVEGNASVTAERVRAKLLSKVGSPLDARLIDTDIKSLMGSKWFSDVTPYYELDKRDPSGKGYVLIFTVKEMPVLQHVEFRGRKAIKLKEIEETTGLKQGNRADSTRTHLAVGQIKRLYEEKGYDLAEVTLIEGGKLGDTRVVIGIFEGPKHTIQSVDFKGNVFASDATLATKIASKTRLLGLLPGKYHRDDLDEDVRKLKEYYQSQGFFEIEVTPVTRSGSELGKVQVEFDISEGVRYKVREISFEGNERIPVAKLREGLALHSGQPILETVKEADRLNLVSKYNEIGCIDTQILPEPRYTNEPGVVDIVYKIEEGEPYITGDIWIHGNDRTKEKVVRREFAMAGILPGEPLDANRINIAKQRISSLGYFVSSPDMGKPLDIKVTNRRPHDKPYGDTPLLNVGTLSLTRMQGPDEGLAVPRLAQGTPALLPIEPAPAASPFSTPNPFNPPPDTPPIPVPIPNAAPPLGAAPGASPVGSGEPPGMMPSIPGLNTTDVGPDRQDAFPGSRYADIVTSLEEAPTGRFMFGVGASSFQGINGNLTVYEKNFDIFNVPRSWNDMISGNAFRGAGQEFRLELMPGTLINRFQVSLYEPYLFDLPIGGRAAGYLFSRVYPDWTEARGGGRFSLGRQFGTQTYADVAFRVEDVNFYGYTSPAPADYLAANGHTTLATIRPSLRFDNRNSAFMPNKGQFLEFSFEQGWGSFTYPKAEVEGRTYFTTGSRPDGSGKRILMFRGHFGVAGSDTPVYERFFAGNFGSLRGFQYRGVGPRVLGKGVGGLMEALGSVEYMFPWTASDKFQQVVFCDFGTVERNYTFNDMRVSVGTGVRVVIPAFGPLPLCFDLAFPVEKADGDRVQYFNFTIGGFF